MPPPFYSASKGKGEDKKFTCRHMALHRRMYACSHWTNNVRWKRRQPPAHLHTLHCQIGTREKKLRFTLGEFLYYCFPYTFASCHEFCCCCCFMTQFCGSLLHLHLDSACCVCAHAVISLPHLTCTSLMFKCGSQSFVFDTNARTVCLFGRSRLSF